MDYLHFQTTIMITWCCRRVQQEQQYGVILAKLVMVIKMNNSEVFQAVVKSNQIWEAKLTSPSDHGPYIISAVSSLGTIQISDVLFGDVWICSGQSNMEFTTNKVKQPLMFIDSKHREFHYIGAQPPSRPELEITTSGTHRLSLQ